MAAVTAAGRKEPGKEAGSAEALGDGGQGGGWGSDRYPSEELRRPMQRDLCSNLGEQQSRQKERSVQRPCGGNVPNRFKHKEARAKKPLGNDPQE